MSHPGEGSGGGKRGKGYTYIRTLTQWGDLARIVEGNEVEWIRVEWCRTDGRAERSRCMNKGG